MNKILRLGAKLALGLIFLGFSSAVLAKSYVVIIPSYNNIQWWRENIESVLYLETVPGEISYRVIYIDDCSTDGTGAAVEQYVNDWKTSSRSQLDITVVRNPVRLGAMSNWYRAVHSCHDDEIVVSLDGDDCLAHNQVLLRLECAYAHDCWLTYGQWIMRPGGKLGQNRALDANSSVRQQPFVTSHLRTFYAGLFKQIKLKDFFDNTNDKFCSIACDVAMMWPMIELCGKHYEFISDVLYIYNHANPIGDDKINVEMQKKTEQQIRAKLSYAPAKTYKADLSLANLKYFILDENNYPNNHQNNYQPELAETNTVLTCPVATKTGLYTTEPYIILDLSLDSAGLKLADLAAKNCNLSSRDFIKELELLQCTGLDVLVTCDNHKIKPAAEQITRIAGELVSPLDINIKYNTDKLNNIFVTRAKYLAINNVKYLILTRKVYAQILNKSKNFNNNKQLDNFKKLSEFVTQELVRENNLVLYQAI